MNRPGHVGSFLLPCCLDAGGKRPQLVGACSEPIFPLLLLCDIPPERNAAPVRQVHDRPNCIQQAAIPHRSLELLPFAGGTRNKVQNLLAIVRVGVTLRDDIDDIQIVFSYLFQSPTYHALPLPIDQLDLPSGLQEIYHHGDVIEYLLEHFFLVPQLLLHPLALINLGPQLFIRGLQRRRTLY